MEKKQTTPNSPIVKPIGNLNVNPNNKTSTSSPILEKFRQPKLLLAVGAKGQGKTHETLEVVEEYWRGNPQTLLKPRKVLILDVNDEYRQYKTIDINHVCLFSAQPKCEVRRITMYKANGQVKDFNDLYDDTEIMLKDFRGGMALIEDISTFVADTLRRDLFGKMCTTRHRNCDLIMHYQGIGSIANKKMLRNANYIRIHKCNDSVSDYEALKENITILKIAENIVYEDFDKALSKNPNLNKSDLMGFFHKDGTYKSTKVYVNLDKNIISGDYNKYHFYHACYKFIMDNPNISINPFLKQKDMRGNAKYTYEQAFQECIKKYFYSLYDGI